MDLPVFLKYGKVLFFLNLNLVIKLITDTYSVKSVANNMTIDAFMSQNN